MTVQLGGHIKIVDSLRHLVMAGRSLDYTVLQTMIGDSHGYDPMEISGADAAELKKMLYGMELYVHLPYTINPCEGAAQRRGFYGRSYKNFCQAASQLGAKGVVIHPGFKKELSRTAARDNLIKFFDKNHEDDWHLQVLLETDAGSKNGSKIGDTEFIAEALELLDNHAHAMCIDTVHLYARGLDLWDPTLRKNYLAKYSHLIKLVHLNSPDPEVTLGSFLDRHNTCFEDRPDWDHASLFEDLQQFPMILERRSLAVQEKDAKFIRTILGDEGAIRGRYARTDARLVERKK